MTELNKKMFDLLINGYSVEQVKEKMNLSSKQFLNRIEQIKNEGYLLKKIFNIDGSSYYQLSNLLNDNEILHINSNSDNFSFILVSDLHIGNKLEGLYKMKEVYEFAKENNIHTIFHVGDFFNGIYTKNGYKFPVLENSDTIEKQIERGINEYPIDKEIMNYILGGNHEYYTVNYGFIDPLLALERNRTDFSSLGYGLKKININSLNFVLFHKLSLTPLENPYELKELTFVGHNHNSLINTMQPKIIKLPTLSDIKFEDNYCEPGFTLVKVTVPHVYVKNFTVLPNMKPILTYNLFFENINPKKLINNK